MCLTSTMKKLKEKMEEWIDENDNEETQEPLRLDIGIFTFATTPPSSSIYLLLCNDDKMHQIWEQEDQSPLHVILELEG